jgi:AhpC/TSA family protein
MIVQSTEFKVQSIEDRKTVIRRLLLIAVIVLMPVVTLLATAESSLLNAKAPDFTLQDQYDRTVALRGLEGRIVVLLASDKEGSAQNPVWQKAIEGRYKDGIIFLGLADVSSVPFFLKGKIRKDFKKQEKSVLLDWKGGVFTAYGLAKKVPNVILIDKRGYIRFMKAGAATPEVVEKLFAMIDHL